MLFYIISIKYKKGAKCKLSCLYHLSRSDTYEPNPVRPQHKKVITGIH